MSDFTKLKDLTRWNRSGLSRFRYVDGNAAIYLEALRLSMREAFTDGDGKNRWSALDTAIPVPVSETAAQRQRRWVDQYRAERRDYAWEILRTFARSLHVLSEHVDAYANEGYLRTTTQWDNLRRLVEMLDYHPAPPASAETPIVLLAKKDKSGTVKAGFAFKNKPDDGSKPAVFETLEDVAVDFRMNHLRPADWNLSQELFVYGESASTTSFPLDAPLEGVSVGTLGVLVIELESIASLGVAVRVTEVSDGALGFLGEAKPTGWPLQVRLHQVRLFLNPKFKQAPQLAGDNVVTLAGGHGLSLGAVVAWKDGSTWKAAKVAQLEGNRAKLSKTAPAVGTKLYLAVHSDVQTMTIGGSEVKRVILPSHDAGSREKWAIFNAGLQKLSSFSTHSQDGVKVYDFVSGDTHSRLYYVPSSGGEIKESAKVLESKPQELTLDGAPGGLVSGGWVIAETSGGNRKAAMIDVLEEGEKSFTLELSVDLGGIGTLFGSFAEDIRPRGHAVNADPIFLTSSALRSDSHSILPLDLDDFPDLLDIGRTLVVSGEDQAMKVTVKEINAAEGWIKVAPAIPGSELSGPGTTAVYTRRHTTIYGNVVTSGHGESRNEKILGSGDATRSGQRFDLDAEEVSFVVDSQFSSGVRAAVEVNVDGRTWKQVSTLNDSEPEDPHYLVRMKQDGKLTIAFGDGRHGRRLPTGNNNVRIRYRQGTGLAGNLDPYSLEKEVKPHPLVGGLLQPILATGGNDMEAIDSMRENGPASVLALDRAVSLADFTHLAAANSGVWQARAFRRPPGLGRTDRIEVAVVPAGGGGLGALGDTLEEYLTAHALPNVEVSVVLYQSLILDLSLTLQIKTDEYDPDLVTAAVYQAVFDAFALQKARLGQTLYSSQVFAVAEAVAGVENCQCVINPEGFRDESGAPAFPRQIGYGREGLIRRVTPEDAQVIYMDEESSILEIIFQEFNL
jgi:hypothetical protein